MKFAPVIRLDDQIAQLAEKRRKIQSELREAQSMLNDEIDDYAPIPDVVVRCGPMVEGGYARDPVFIAEVLSPSTMNNDRGRKHATAMA